MSVRKPERNVSDAEFLHVAREIHIRCIRKCVKFPKRYTFYVSQDIAEVASNIHKFIVRGNSIYPTTQHEAELRRDLFIKAASECRTLISLLETADELFGIESGDMMELSSVVFREINLIKGEMKSARKRYKELI